MVHNDDQCHIYLIIFQDPLALPSVKINMCIHSPPDYLLGAHILNSNADKMQNNSHKDKLDLPHAIVKSLSELYKELDKNVSDDKINDDNLLKQWASLKKDIISEYIFNSWSSDMSLKSTHWMHQPVPSTKEVVYLCEIEGVDCLDFIHDTDTYR